MSETTQWSAEGTGWMARLTAEGLVTDEVLQSALRESNDDPRHAGEWLVDHGCISHRDLILVQAEAFRMPYVESGEYRVNLENRTVIPEEMARTQHVFPLFVCDRIITLAVAWPLELTVLDRIRLHTGCEVDQCLTGRRDLNNLIEWAYGDFQELDAERSNAAIEWEDILKDVADAPAVKLVNVLLDQAAASHASDVHIDAEERSLRVRFRLDGVLREVPAPPKELLPAIAVSYTHLTLPTN